MAELKAEGVEAIAICFINSHANPEHERQAFARLKEITNEAFVTASIEVNPEIMEYERTSTTVMNAVLGPRCDNTAARSSVACATPVSPPRSTSCSRTAV